MRPHPLLKKHFHVSQFLADLESYQTHLTVIVTLEVAESLAEEVLRVLQEESIPQVELLLLALLVPQVVILPLLVVLQELLKEAPQVALLL